MTLGQKVRYLRLVEGELRGLPHEMSQQDVVRAVKSELGQSISQSYLSQIESGARPHLTNSTRLLLARFFKVHPGYLVEDPPGYHTELTSDLRAEEASLDRWLVQAAEQFAGDPELRDALLKVARAEDSRDSLILLARLVQAPNLIARLTDALGPQDGDEPSPGSSPEISWLQ
jgi:transcriptional regulator with XRE-family HTH domain